MRESSINSLRTYFKFLGKQEQAKLQMKRWKEKEGRSYWNWNWQKLLEGKHPN
jgi:hypothetical protein